MAPSKSVRLVRAFLFLLLIAGPAPAQQSSLTIIHTNDLHARLMPDEQGRGGFAYVASAIKKEKESSRSVLVLDAGDLVQGTPVSSIYEGVPCYEIANAMGLDAGSLGNHEFDYGWKRALDFIKTARFPVVSANVVNGRGDLLARKPYVILEVGGLRVAIVGALTESLPKLTRQDTRGPWKAIPVADAVRRYASEVRAKSDLVVVLGHLASDEDERFLRKVPDVALVVGGHNHAGQKEVLEIDGRLAVKVRAYGVELGRLDLTVDKEKKRIVQYQWRRIPITTQRYQPDPKVAALVQKWESKVAARVDIPIGEARHAFNRAAVKAMIEKAMAAAVGAEIAYMNPGGVRDGLPKGQVLVRHAWNIMPFDNVTVYGRIKGRQIPSEATDGRHVDPDREYTFATNNFVLDQWKATGPRLEGQGPLVRDALINWIKKRKVLE